MRQLYQLVSLWIAVVCWLGLPARAQVSRVSMVTSRFPAARPTLPVPKARQTIDSLQRLTQPGYYSARFSAKAPTTSAPKARVATDECSSYLCAAVTSPAISVSLANTGPLTCSVASVTLTATASSGATGTYAFTGPDGPVTNSTNTAIVTKAGTYTVTLTPSAGQSATAVTTVAENKATPTASLTVSNSGLLTCSQTSVTVTADGGTSQNLLGPGGVIALTNGKATISTVGTYTLSVTGTNGCSATTSATVTENKTLPNAGLQTDGSLSCTKSTVTLTASPNNGASYAFTGPGGPLNSTGNSATVTHAGTYSVTVTGTNGCTATATTSVTATPPPTASVSPLTTTICAGQTATLMATPGVSYRWSNQQTGQSIGVTSTGAYSVTVTDASGCSASATASVTVNAVPVVSISPSTTAICTGQSVTLMATPGLSYRWSNQQTGPSIVVNATGTYSVTATSANTCSASATASVTVNPVPPTPTLVTQSGGLYPAGKTAVTVAQYSGSVTLVSAGCPGGTVQWWGPNNTTGTGPVTVSTNQTGRLVYQAICQVGACSSPPTSATVTVVADQLRVIAPSYDCATGLLTLRTTGGNGQPIEFNIGSVTSGWTSSTTVDPFPDKKKGPDYNKKFTIQARQLQSDGKGYDNGQDYKEYQVPVCGSGNQPSPLQLLTPAYDCGTGLLTLYTTGGNGQPVEFNVSSATSGWTTNPVVDLFADKKKGPDYSKKFTIQARQLQTDGKGYDNAPDYKEYQVTGCGSARLAAEPVAQLAVVVLGNPVAGAALEVEVRGAEGQPLRLELTSLTGLLVREQQIEQATAVERYTLSLGLQPPGTMLLRVSTPTQSQTVRVIHRQ